MLFRGLPSAAVLAATVLACGSGDPGAGRPLVDDTGRPITLEGPPQRIVSLSPDITELLFAIGAGDRLVGRTRWGDYPSPAEQVPSVGDGLNPNVEMILSRHPDLVVFYASPSNDHAVQQLAQLAIATVSVRTDRLVDFARAARLLGRLTRQQAVADSLVQWLEREVRDLQTTRPLDEVPSALLLAWDNPPIAIGSGSFLSEILELAGARNVFGDVERPSVPVTIETIAERDPDVVVVTADSGAPAWATRPEWRSVTAVRERRFVMAVGSEFGRPSFRAPAAVRRLRTALAEQMP